MYSLLLGLMTSSSVRAQEKNPQLVGDLALLSLRPLMGALPAAHRTSRESATTLAWIVCGQTGWKPGILPPLTSNRRCPTVRKQQVISGQGMGALRCKLRWRFAVAHPCCSSTQSG